MLRAAVVVLCGRTAYATKVESSITFTVGTSSYAAGTNGHLYVKLLSGTTPIPMSSTVSAPAYSGPCSVTDQDSILDDWSGGSGWLKLDDIDVSARGITSSQSLGSLDPTLPLTHIEFYSTSANGMRVGDVIIQVGGTQYGLPAGWDSYANYALLETDSCPKWWMEIEMRFLSTPAPSPRPTPQPTPGPSPETAIAPTAGTCFSDDFSSIDSSWISVDGDWSWSGGTVDNNVGNSGEGNVLYRDADYSDGYLEASVSLSSGQAGLLFRITNMPSAANYFNNAGQMYYCGILQTFIGCGRMNNAWLGNIFTYSTAITYGQFYDLGINMEGSKFTVFLDGAEIGSFSDSSYSSGGIGLRTYAGRCIYDSISYEAPGCAESYIFQAGRCYPQSEAPVINTAGLMSSTLRRTGTPQECYDYCTGSSGFSIMGLDLRPTGGQDCQCNHPSVKSHKRGETKSRFARRQSSRGRLQRRGGL